MFADDQTWEDLMLSARVAGFSQSEYLAETVLTGLSYGLGGERPFS
jgi:hypothetical protein